MNLFNFGEFTLSSGKTSNFKIDCDALTDEDIDALAKKVFSVDNSPYFDIIGVPTGGDRFANALKKHYTLSPDSPYILIVDDVLTTGISMEDKKKEVQEQYPDKQIFGLVMFSRTSSYALWIEPIFIIEFSL